MHFSWLGTTAVKIQTKPADKDVTILIDPYKPAKGAFPRSLLADIVLYTRGAEGSITVSGNPFILSTPGECEIHNVLMTAVSGDKPGSTMVRIDAEGMSVAHLGLAIGELTDQQLDVLGGVDVLFIPVGDLDCYGARSAVKAINAIEPRVIIPIAHHSDNDPDAKTVDGFVKELGIQSEQTEKKVILKKKDLPQEESRVVVLAKE
ncbi:MAG: hypothetical protein A3J66_02525 [Candidatus Magasanikbacteria bacterium RIFCSPHIGHO2_02_FULL_47_14]|uniref:Zn-dependent hydrolase n=1 Tax=Candidatus Magasanikbacteria bacterium RIFCSPHIGHO2_02_FULL_47_14 TaxID=1798680 RepID=A0A1F6M8I1_9BACT|nr:MAG: hypothetical protein A3J66_02525 [Candidatus Magasanikbacteria bacterium RIFCSPHIGHO2_02_FULL_47_14]